MKLKLFPVWHHLRTIFPKNLLRFFVVTLLLILGATAIIENFTPLAQPATAQSYVLAAHTDIYAHRIFTTRVEFTGATPGNYAVGALTELDGFGNPFIGDATMKVYNVAPVINGFLVRGEIDWDSDIRVRVTVLFK